MITWTPRLRSESAAQPRLQYSSSSYPCISPTDGLHVYLALRLPSKSSGFPTYFTPDVPIPDDGCRAITLLLKYMRRRAKLSSPQLRVCVGWLRGRSTAVFAFGETYALGIPNVLPRPHFLPTDWQVNEVRKMCQARGPPHWFLDGEILYPDRVLAPDTRARTMLYKRASRSLLMSRLHPVLKRVLQLQFRLILPPMTL
jgi:hypothetical protein